MKHVSKKSALLLFSLVVAVLIGCVNAILITVDNRDNILHKIRLHTLNVWSGDEYAKFLVGEDWEWLWFSSWLIIWDNTTLEYSWHVGVFQWWWKDNKFIGTSDTGYYIWIWWWSDNEVEVTSSDNYWIVVGWWNWNKAEGNLSVVVGWNRNLANNPDWWVWWVVVWWFNNKASSQSVVLWWNSNRAKWESSLAFWYSAMANDSNSFSWNAINTKDHSARIDALSWVLIGTYTGIDGVNLVVNGAVKIDSRNFTWDGVKWEIAVVNWCFYSYDGNNWQVINKWGGCPSDFLPDWSCVFWNVILLNWESMSGYSTPYDKNCNWKKWTVTCDNEELSSIYVYPYCYKLS